MRMHSPELPTPADLAGRLARLQSAVLGEPERAKVELLEILGHAKKIEAKSPEALALLEIARCEFLQGKYDLMLEMATQALVVTQNTKIAKLECRALNSIGLAYQRMGQLDRAMRYFMDSLHLSQQILDNESAARALSNIALVYSILKEYDSALELHEQALEVAQQSGQAIYTANLLASLLEDHYFLRNYAKVLEMSEDAISFARGHGFSRFECSTRFSLAKVLVDLQRYQAALRVTRLGLRIARWAKDLEMTSSILRVSGRALFGLGQHDEAIDKLQEGLDIASSIKNKDDELEIHSLLASIYENQGNYQKGAHHRKKCAEINDYIFGSDASKKTQVVIQEFRHHMYGDDTRILHSWSSELRELTKNLKRANTEVSYRLAHDALTGALNRPHFQSQAQKVLDSLSVDDVVGIVFISLDQMKTVNEIFGTVMGDGLLAEVVHRLRNTLRAGDLIGRLGSDEFVLLLNYMASADDLILVLKKLFRVIGSDYHIRGQKINLTISLGGVVAPKDAGTLEELFNCADIALQQVKNTGRNGIKVYEAELDGEEQRKRNLAYDLRQAELKNELVLYYQGQFDVISNQICGFEALIRWQHPQLGLLSPAYFIDIAEENRLILEIGDWVLNEACAQAVRWKFAERGLIMAVNVSALQFRQTDFVKNVRSALDNHRLAGECLVLELTESMVQDDGELASDNIEKLQEMGVNIALDDFGTGFSNLMLLQNLSLQVLKIDRSFLREFQTHNEKYKKRRMMLETIIQLAHNMDMSVVAEGVEEPEQLALLADMNCDKLQGYLLSKPLPATEAQQLLAHLPVSRKVTTATIKNSG